MSGGKINSHIEVTAIYIATILETKKMFPSVLPPFGQDYVVAMR